MLVVGAGSVGLDVLQRLAATGIVEIGVMDFDRVDVVNRDRMVGATRRDARLRRRKVDVAARLARLAATADGFKVYRHHTSICSPEGLTAALDYDVIFSCVDRPWPRAVLNSIAYADLIPVIDGGIAID
ncbi:ThiF family adenylyltransferase, partial [Xanthomonas citri pv. citri]